MLRTALAKAVEGRGRLSLPDHEVKGVHGGWNRLERRATGDKVRNMAEVRFGTTELRRLQ